MSLQLDSVHKLDDSAFNAREAVEWDKLAATGAFAGVKSTPPPMTLKEQMERMRIVRHGSSEVVRH